MPDMKIKLGLSRGINVGKLGVIGGGGAAGDTTAPTVTITSTASTITAAAFTVTVTFSEAVVGFDNTKITVVNGSAGAVSGSGPYTSTITPTATGMVTVQVEAGKVTDAAGNANTASNTFSILYISADLWLDFSDISTLFQNSARSTPVTADGQPVGGVADKSGSNFHASQTTDAKRPVYKTNIQNSKSAVLFDAAALSWLTFAPTGVASGLSVFLVATPAVSTQSYILDGSVSNWACVITKFAGKNYEIFSNGGNDRGTLSTDATGMNLLSYKAKSDAIIGRFNGSQVYVEATPGDMTGKNVAFLGTSAGTGGYYSGHVCELIAIDAYLSDSVMAAIENYLNTKWVLF